MRIFFYSIKARYRYKFRKKFVIKKPIKPDKNETAENIRSRSAKLRYAVRNNNSFIYPTEFTNKFLNYSKLEAG